MTPNGGQLGCIFIGHDLRPRPTPSRLVFTQSYLDRTIVRLDADGPLAPAEPSSSAAPRRVGFPPGPACWPSVVSFDKGITSQETALRSHDFW